jgi:hypothetical protein
MKKNLHHFYQLVKGLDFRIENPVWQYTILAIIFVGFLALVFIFLTTPTFTPAPTSLTTNSTNATLSVYCHSRALVKA